MGNLVNILIPSSSYGFAVIHDLNIMIGKGLKGKGLLLDSYVP